MKTEPTPTPREIGVHYRQGLIPHEAEGDRHRMMMAGQQPCPSVGSLRVLPPTGAPRPPGRSAFDLSRPATFTSFDAGSIAACLPCRGSPPPALVERHGRRKPMVPSAA